MDIIISISRLALPIITVILLIKCILTLWLGNTKETIYGYIVDLQNRQRYPLNMWETSIGRAKTCDISIDYTGFSRVQAVITRRIDGWYIYNTNDRSPNKVNDAEAEKRQTMQHGDIITMGGKRFIFEVADDPVIKVGKQKKKQTVKGNVSAKGDTASTKTAAKAPVRGAITKQYCLINKKTGETFVLCGNEVKIGRGWNCDIKLPSLSMIKVYAMAALYEDGWALESTGVGDVCLNGKKITQAQLFKNGDIITIGNAELRYEVRNIRV